MSFNSVGIVLVAAMLVKMSNAGGSSRGFVYSERDKVGCHDLGTGYRSYMIFGKGDVNVTAQSCPKPSNVKSQPIDVASLGPGVCVDPENGAFLSIKCINENH